ncbi:unnamed protein product [Prorocentrum cordatum]|uniref:Uncharacterized protein n=1 Tax=Prorocentrum cordatum TaxID=2364126 RepID=A0ABN9W555_9DINO|nr:unnamed protein product [Polarella glacialis]
MLAGEILLASTPHVCAVCLDQSQVLIHAMISETCSNAVLCQLSTLQPPGWRSPERQQPPPPERHEPPQGSPIEAIERLCEKFPDGAAQMDHAVSCDLPKAAVGQILGEDERYKLRVERETGTIISVDTSPGPDHLTIMVTGPLLWVYVAHCMVMSRYHELEQEKENRRRGDEASDNTISRVEELQAQLLALQGQLAEVTRSKGSAKGSGRR